MQTVNALKIRQAFGSVLSDLHKRQSPILIEKGRQPVAVLISIKDFEERFLDYQEKQKRDYVMGLAEKSAVSARQDSTAILRELRYGPDSNR